MSATPLLEADMNPPLLTSSHPPLPSKHRTTHTNPNIFSSTPSSSKPLPPHLRHPCAAVTSPTKASLQFSDLRYISEKHDRKTESSRG
ncbi:hypothetical protein HanIR_Chr08g0365711 [Helianthus annuus]|nr:hypothetical protein HanIR_Chr08g0365711 [Helianthus annuus]